MNRSFVYSVIFLGLALGFGLASALTAQAHGANITYRTVSAIEVQGIFDSGEPMAEAQVTVYAPDDPINPWQTGIADENGRYVFIPDVDLPGTWDVQVRVAGHGEIVHIPFEPDGDSVQISGGDDGYTTGQIALMAGSVIWGFVGTALYFEGRKAKRGAA